MEIHTPIRKREFEIAANREVLLRAYLFSGRRIKIEYEEKGIVLCYEEAFIGFPSSRISRYFLRDNATRRGITEYYETLQCPRELEIRENQIRILLLNLLMNRKPQKTK